MLIALFNYLAHVWGPGHYYQKEFENQDCMVQKCTVCRKKKVYWK